MIPMQRKVQAAVPCFHGGAFFSAVGERFDALERIPEVINADVLDRETNQRMLEIIRSVLNSR